MKKITYFETLKEKTKQGNYQFAEFTGTLESLYDEKTDSIVNVVFRKDDKMKWKATHLESGILITSGFESKKECLDKVVRILNHVAKVLKNDKSIERVIEELEIYKNEVLIHAIERFNKGA